MPLRREVAHQLLPAPAAWLPCALDRRLASASVSSKAIIAILSKTRLIARMVSFSQSVLSCVAATIKTIGIVDVAALSKLAPLGAMLDLRSLAPPCRTSQ